MSKQTILIADDDFDLLKIEETFLLRAGYSVLRAQDAYRALHLVLAEKPNLLVLDMNMPAGNGLSVHQRMRTAPACQNIPVIYLTGQPSQQIVTTAREMGAFALMYKPIDFEVLLTNIKAALAESSKNTQKEEGPRFDSNVSWVVAAKPQEVR